VELTREELKAAPVSGRLTQPGVGLLRVAEFGKTTVDQIRTEVAALAKNGATRLVIDLRGTAFGDAELGVAAARLFVPSGTLAYRQERAKGKEPIAAAANDGSITLPVAVLTDNGTSSAAEVFASALAGNKRAALVGERTLGRAAQQRLVRLPDGSGLLLTHLLYLTPSEAVINEKGLTPDVVVEQPDLEFGQPLPTPDATIDRAIEHLKTR
jgi:carboxyl-terminal processing protease